MRLSTEDGVHSARKPLPSRPFHRLPIDSRLQVRHHCLVSVSIFCFPFLSFFFFNFVPFHRSEGIIKVKLFYRIASALETRHRIEGEREYGIKDNGRSMIE